MSESERVAADQQPAGHRAGYVAIVGRPNVGKSTLLNRILGRKIAIVTPKPQTTRRRVLGIKSRARAQLLFFDTPGLHAARDVMNERMVARARESVAEADVALWLVDATAGPGGADAEIATWLTATGRPIIVAPNKIDCVDKRALLPLIEAVSRQLPSAEIVPVSAVTGDGVERLLDVIEGRLPEGPPFYPADDITDESERAIVAEIVREQVMLHTRDEVPYGTAVTVDAFEEKPGSRLVVIKATIHVERESQKPIVIGGGGQSIKSIGERARREIERLLERRVFLELFVRVQPGWTKRLGQLKEFGL
jgi:GTP-binding protein Era